MEMSLKGTGGVGHPFKISSAAEYTNPLRTKEPSAGMVSAHPNSGATYSPACGCRCAQSWSCWRGARSL